MGLFHYRFFVSKLDDYVNLADFALTTLCLPHANADCERIFSRINCIKTKLRNKLKTDTINGLLHTKEHLSHTDKNCVNFEPSKKMLTMVNEIMYTNVKCDNLDETDNLI